MTDLINNGGPAFPRSAVANDYGIAYGEQDGMSLRDWFASQAPVTIRQAAIGCGWDSQPESILQDDAARGTLWAVMSMMRYEYADAMIAARKGGAA